MGRVSGVSSLGSLVSGTEDRNTSGFRCQKPALGLVLALLMTVGCSLPGSSGESTTTQDLSVTTEAPVIITPPTTTVSDDGAAVYVLKLDAEKATLVPVWRGIDATPKAALVELVRGLTTRDTEDKLLTTLPDRLVISKLEVQGDLVAVEFQSGLETLTDPDRQAAAAQIIYTLTQFEGVSKATITTGTTPVDVPGLGPAVGLTRESFFITGLVPNLFIDRPAWHEPVSEPGVSVSGRALDVVDANLSYEIQGTAGGVLQDGFITTTGMAGWAPFVDFVDLPSTAKDEVRLVVFLASESGERRFLQTIPLEVS